MPSVEETLSRELACARDQLFLKATGMETGVVLSACDELEASFIARLAEFPDLLNETRRRMAESRFDLLAYRDVRWDMLEELHTRIRTLGYADIEREATREIIFARASIRHRRTELAEPVLQHVCDKLNDHLRTESSVLYEDTRKTCEELLNSLRQ